MSKYTAPKTMRVWGWPYGFHKVTLIERALLDPAQLIHIASLSNGKLYSCPKYFVHSRPIKWYNLKGHDTRNGGFRLYQEEVDANYWWVR